MLETELARVQHQPRRSGSLVFRVPENPESGGRGVSPNLMGLARERFGLHEEVIPMGLDILEFRHAIR